MIPQGYIEEWKEQAPWPNDAQVEQDLVIARVLVELFSDHFIRDSLALRGGTALHKLYCKPQVRYSEDIDLVQLKAEPISPVFKRIREKLLFLGSKRAISQHIHNNTIIYRFKTEIQPIINMRLKIEINTREHFNVLGLHEIPFEVENSWFTGKCNLTGYKLEEILGTKLRALYQRSKGRDLFDLYWALTHQNVETLKVVECYTKYMEHSVGKLPSRKQFLMNTDEKSKDNEFTSDILALLKPEVEYNTEKAWELVCRELIGKM